MQRWEYNDVVVAKTDAHQTIQLLDQAGQDGWEFTGYVEELPRVHVYIVKRPLEDERTTTKRSDVKHTHSIRISCNRNCPHRGTPDEITSMSFL